MVLFLCHELQCFPHIIVYWQRVTFLSTATRK